MDKFMKCFWSLIIIIVACSIVYGNIHDDFADKKGKLEVTGIALYNNTYDVDGSYAVSCDVKTLVFLDYLRLKTVYYDKNGNILAENNVSTVDMGPLLDSTTLGFNEQIGYVGDVVPDKVELIFFDTNDFIDSKYIYKTSIKVQYLNK